MGNAAGLPGKRPGAMESRPDTNPRTTGSRSVNTGTQRNSGAATVNTSKPK